MPLAVVSGIDTGEAPVSYVFAEVNLVQYVISTTEERARAYLKTELTNDQ